MLLNINITSLPYANEVLCKPVFVPYKKSLYASARERSCWSTELAS